MDKTQLKHRIVGAIVLVALGVIFIPMILTTDNEFIISDTNIPAKPAELEQLAHNKVPAPAPVPPRPVLEAEIVDEPSVAKAAVQPAPVKHQTKAPPEPTAKKTTEPATTTSVKPQTKESRAWVVQVASFSDRDKALKLRDRLRKAKYPTFVESISAKQTKHFRVRVGPVVRREHADQWRETIAKDFKVPDALVMAHPG